MSLRERRSYKALGTRRISHHMRGLEDLHQSRIKEDFAEEMPDTMEYSLNSGRTEKAEVEDGIEDDTDAIFKVGADSTEEAMICGSFPILAIFMTEKLEGYIGRRYRWTDTLLSGSLQLTVRGEFENLPLAYIKVFEATENNKRDSKVCDESKIVFEFELPLNF